MVNEYIDKTLLLQEKYITELIISTKKKEIIREYRLSQDKMF